MDKKKIEVILSEDLLAAAEARFKECGCESVDDYIETLIANDLPLPFTPEPY